MANYNFLWCSQAKGEKNPNAGTNLEKLATKAEFIKALNDAVCLLRRRVHCADRRLRRGDDRHHAGRAASQTRNLRMGLLILNYGHNNEIYGSMVILSADEEHRAVRLPSRARSRRNSRAH